MTTKNLQTSSAIYDVRNPKLDKEESKKIHLASIDKPWNKFYSEEVIKSELPHETMYDYIVKDHEKYENKVALNYFDRKITYKELFNNIEQTANALIKYGVKQGDIVTVAMPTTPESIYLLYALNKIGAVGNYIDPRTSKDGLEDYIKEADSEMIFVLDSISDKLRDIKDRTIINVPPTESMPMESQLNELKKMYKKAKIDSPKLSKIGNLKSSISAFKKVLSGLQESKKAYGYTGCIQWSEFYKAGEIVVISKDMKYKSLYYDKDAPAVIVHTGGTTGKPKGAILTNDNLNSAAYDCCAAGYDFQSNQSWLNIMPLFIAYGCGNGLHLPLACKMEVIVIPAFESKEFPSLLDKYKPNHMVGVPEHYGHIVESELLKDADLSYVIAPTVGGDAMNIGLEEKTNEFLRNHNCDYKVVKGYGMTEVCAAVCACTSNETNELGSVGIPFPHSVISVFEEGTENELPYGRVNGEYQVGEICVNTPNMMKEYHNNEKETEKILRTHKDGTTWVHSGDLGYINENGEIFIIGRSKDMVIRHDGFKIYPNLIEEIITEEKLVDACKVVSFDDPKHTQGQLPMAFVTLNGKCEDEDKVLERIKSLCSCKLQEYSQPYDIMVVDTLPLTNIGKVDTKTLRKMANDYIKA